MEIILSILIPGLLLAYYMKSAEERIKHNRGLGILLIGGTFMFYVGLVFRIIDPTVESLLKLGGACLFFTGVALLTIGQEHNSDRVPDQDEDKP